MRIDDNTASDMGVALNEAIFMGAEYDPDRNLVATTFSVLTLPEDNSPEPFDPRRQIVLTNIGRIAAAMRVGSWDDPGAKIIPFEASDLLSVVQSFDGQPINGWEFINHEDSAFDDWKDQHSLDISPPNGSLDNRMVLYQEKGDQSLVLLIWFDEFHIRDASGEVIELQDFIADGNRWWDALFDGGPRVEYLHWSTGTNRGIVTKARWDQQMRELQTQVRSMTDEELMAVHIRELRSDENLPMILALNEEAQKREDAASRFPSRLRNPAKYGAWVAHGRDVASGRW